MPLLDLDVLEEHVPPRGATAPVFSALPSWAPFQFTGEDALRLTVHNSVAGVVVTVAYRLLLPSGIVHPASFTFTPSADRAPSTVEFTIGDGLLLNVSAFVSTGTVLYEQTFARLQIIRGRGASAIVLGTILQDYVTSNQDVAWPGSPIHSSIERSGALRSITGTNPAAGVEISETVPAGARWELVMFSFTLVTAAGGVDRSVVIAFDNGATVYFKALANQQQGASATVEYYFAQGATQAQPFPLFVSCTFIPITGRLLAGHRIRTVTSSFAAGDNYSAPIFTVREWQEAS